MPSILIADDHAPNRYLRSRLLGDAGYDIVESDSAETTLDTVFKGDGDLSLVLLDVGLPDGDGFAVCRRIKATRPALPVVLVSAIYRTAYARRDGMHAGANAYLVEPVPPARLLRTVEDLTSGAPAVAPAHALITTTATGHTLWANEAAAALLNTGLRALSGRNLLMFFDGERERVQAELARAVAGQICTLDARVRPRECRPVDVRVEMVVALDGGATEVDWKIEQLSPERASRRGRDTRATEPQVLWRAFRAGSSMVVTAAVAPQADGTCTLQLRFGSVGTQRTACATAAAAHGRAEAVWTRLEGLGYQRELLATDWPGSSR